MRNIVIAALKEALAGKLPEMTQLNKSIKDELTKYFDLVVEDYELRGVKIEEVPHERSDGFIPHTQGGWQARGFQNYSDILMNDTWPKNKEADKAIEDGIEYNKQIAREEIFDDNKGELEDSGITKKNINDSILEDKGFSNLAIKLENKIDDYHSDETSEVLFGIGVFYYEPDRDDKMHSVYVYSEINWEAPYFRTGKGASVAPFEEDIDFETASDLMPKLREALYKAAKSIASSGAKYKKPAVPKVKPESKKGKKPAKVVRLRDYKRF